MPKVFKVFFLLILCIFCTRCTNFPKDPENTLENVRGKILRVGITNNEPFANFSRGKAEGIEVNLIRAIAKDLDADIKWHQGSMDELMLALNANALDIVIGGISRDSPWSEEIGFTKPYCKLMISISSGSSTHNFKDFKDVEIGVENSGLIAHLVHKKGGIPVMVNDIKNFKGPIAAYNFQLQKLNLPPGQEDLKQDEKVFAIPRGENAWAVYLEKFFSRNQNKIEKFL